MLRSAPPSASIRPSGLTSKLVTGFLETVRVLRSSQVVVSHVVMKALRSMPLFPPLPRRPPPDTACGVAFTIVKRREAVEERPKRAARKEHLRDLERTGDWMTWNGSGWLPSSSLEPELGIAAVAASVCQMCIR